MAQIFKLRGGDGVDFPALATAAITGGQFVNISAVRTGGPGLSTDTTGNSYRIAPASAGGVSVGMAMTDCTGTGTTDLNRTTVFTAGIVPCVAQGAVTFGTQIEVSANGNGRTLASGVAVGKALTSAADGATFDLLLNVA